MTNRIRTAGHSTRDVYESVTMLRKALPPGSEYRWMPRLGGRRHAPEDVPEPDGAWRVKAFRTTRLLGIRPATTTNPASLNEPAHVEDGRPACPPPPAGERP
ncbi:hypothetical protein ACFWN1_29240 [Streptomyces sp. NPDC058459]|uniref:hypothetical protein n=1 Tax=Streptomyces sp. NPDC058459 TaxID=3346508 RepID=UPI0036525AFC